jgi:hypothetical protein
VNTYGDKSRRIGQEGRVKSGRNGKDKIVLEDLKERENVGVLVVDERSVLKHCKETGHNDVISVNIGSF